jgi:CDP-glucose 4,6-dehydratase
MFNDIYNGKTVLITGHTGVKGTLITSWLLQVGAKVVGVSDCIPTQPSMFEELGLESEIEHNLCDVRDLNSFKKILLDSQPDFVFHLAAQPIVSTSYHEPIETIATNVMGTANVLESLRYIDKKCTAIIITSDKCYENVEWEWGYKETDAVGGKDIYSGSKGAAEIIFHSYVRSFFYIEKKSNVRLATGRAGNVIGGGDWAKDRIVVDCMESWSKGQVVEIRSPSATRPWQHVLEPLSGYLTLGMKLDSTDSLHGESFNFGPKSEKNKTVEDLLHDLSNVWGFESVENAYAVTGNIPFNEAGLLKLNCDKALFYLDWEANLYYDECVDFVASWYVDFYKNNKDMRMRTSEQISSYECRAKDRRIVWAK